MELLLSRSQKTGFTGLGAITFVLNLRSKLTADEAGYVQTYKLGKDILYEKASVMDKLPKLGPWQRIFSFFAAKAKGHIFTVNDLVKGRTVECKDIIEMIEAEEQIKVAAQNFHNVLQTCQQFGGEEVIKYPRDE